MALSMLLLSACSTATPESTPTVDINALRTEVAATVFAQVSEAVALTPTVTPIPSFTPTIAATNTPLVTSTTAVSITPGALSAPITGTVTATLQLRNQAAWVSQTIADGVVFEPSETFTITWTLKNVGESTWTTGYRLRFFSGDAFGAASEYTLGQIVPPQGTINITIPMTAPAIPGNYRTDWVLSDERRANFNDPIFLKITVAAPPTPTRTATTPATAAATATP